MIISFKIENIVYVKIINLDLSIESLNNGTCSPCPSQLYVIITIIIPVVNYYDVYYCINLLDIYIIFLFASLYLI